MRSVVLEVMFYLSIVYKSSTAVYSSKTLAPVVSVLFNPLLQSVFLGSKMFAIFVKVTITKATGVCSINDLLG